MFCPNCEATVDFDDNFCRQCGAPLNGAGLPVAAPRAYSPLPLRNIALVMAQGVATLALSTVLEMAVRSLLPKVLRWPPSGARDRKAASPAEEYYLPIETHTESQTVLVRRVKVRQP